MVAPLDVGGGIPVVKTQVSGEHPTSRNDGEPAGAATKTAFAACSGLSLPPAPVQRLCRGDQVHAVWQQQLVEVLSSHLSVQQAWAAIIMSATGAL